MSEMKLYEVNEQLERLFALDDGTMVDGETGEVFDAAAVEALQMARTEKIQNCIRFYKNAITMAKAIKAEADALTKRAKAKENQAQHVLEYLQRELQPREKVEFPEGAVKWRASESVKVDVDPSLLPGEFLKVTVEARKADIKKAIKAGREIPGAHIEQGLSMSIK